MNATGHNTQYKEDGSPTPCFGDLYVEVRHKERRILSDKQVMFLPDAEPDDVHFKEWQIRKRSAGRLVAHLRKKNRPLDILDIGCGNGWLSSKLTSIKNVNVTGIDANEPEIAQARRVFKESGVHFICGDFDPDAFAGKKFDIILFAASIQYFPGMQAILRAALSILSSTGEIHIMDTNFYKAGELSAAMQRTAAYYATLGYPEMATHYFHHSINDLRPFNHQILFNPHSLINKISKNDPFYWITVKHS